MIFKYRGIEFGGQHGAIIVTDFEPGASDIRGEDTPRPQHDGVIVGRRFYGGRTWAFDLVTNQHTAAEAYAVEAKLAAAWQDEKVRAQAGVLQPLSYNLGDGKWRRVYGVPGRYAGPRPDIKTRQGAGRITADFEVKDRLHYDDAEQHVRLTIVPASTGGLTAPLVAPLVTVSSGTPRAGFVTNSGDARTPLRAVFRGPVVDPWVRAAAGWEIGLQGTLAYDQAVTVDALAGTVLRGNTPVPGMLTRKTRLTEAKLPPGQSELTFGGTDLTGTATVDLYWRNAFAGIGG